MPSAGAAVRSVAAGRQEILSLLQRRRHPEVLESGVQHCAAVLPISLVDRSYRVP